MAPLNNCSTAPLLTKMASEGQDLLSPVARQFCDSSSEEIATTDHNHNDISPKAATEQIPDKAAVKPPPKRRSFEEINGRTRKMIFSMFEKHLNTNLNVLVIGRRGSGKTSLINSMCMALSQKWSDKARYCPGRNHVIDECVVHKNKSGGKVVFADTRGFEDIHDTQHAVLILRYVLEGRIPAKCIPCVLLMNKELIKKRYHRGYDPKKRIDCVLYVSAIDEQPSTHLMKIVQEALTTSKHSAVNRVPIVSVTTKCDLLSDNDRSHLEVSRGFLKYSLEQRMTPSESGGGIDHPPRKACNYRCELEPFSDESANPTSVEPSVEKDIHLLAIWRDIIARTTACGGDVRKRAYSTPSSSRPQMCSCLPFTFDYARLRSGSF